jgi:peroxiredoxin
MDNWHKKVELLANVAIIFIAIILGAILVNRYLLSAPTPPAVAERPGIQSGTKLSLPGMEWGRSRRTLLMVLSTNCHYCTESAPFYQKLAQEKTKHTDVGLLAVLPQSVEESRKYLDEHDVRVDEVRQVSPGALNVSGTPTLILVDQSGSVIESWVGKLSPEKEGEVLKRVLVQGTDD